MFLYSCGLLVFLFWSSSYSCVVMLLWFHVIVLVIFCSYCHALYCYDLYWSACRVVFVVLCLSYCLMIVVVCVSSCACGQLVLLL